MHWSFAVMGLFGLVSYLLTVLLLGETVAGLEVGMVEWFLLELAALGLCAVSLRMRRGVSGRQALLGVGIVSVTLTVCLVVADLATYLLAASGPTRDSRTKASEFDRNTWVSEWYPRLYYPTVANFRLHKPSYRTEGTHFGSFYRPYMLDSPTLASQVLERQEIEIHINDRGFREHGGLESCRVFALGDSFTFGHGITDAGIWTERLEPRIGECVYNLGISDASPKQELELLRHFLASKPAPHIERLIWMIYEGNDLEDSYAEQKPEVIPPGPWDAIEGTLVAATFSTILNLKTESMIDRIRKGRIRFDLSDPGDGFEYVVDGVRTPYPIVHSPTLGYLLLYPPYLRTAYADATYFENHPNMDALRRVFEDMRALSLEKGFDVTVVMAPTSISLYAPHFSALAALPIKRRFARMTAGLAQACGFGVVDLFPLLAPAARSEMLYFRDDNHWNPRGHEVVAEALARGLKDL